MSILQNTLYVTTQGAYVGKDGEAVVVRVEGAPVLRVPMHHLAGIVCFGHVSCSPALMGACGERAVAISLLTESGRFLARVEGPVSGNVLLRREQYRARGSGGLWDVEPTPPTRGPLRVVVAGFGYDLAVRTILIRYCMCMGLRENVINIQ